MGSSEPVLSHWTPAASKWRANTRRHLPSLKRTRPIASLRCLTTEDYIFSIFLNRRLKIIVLRHWLELHFKKLFLHPFWIGLLMCQKFKSKLFVQRSSYKKCIRKCKIGISMYSILKWLLTQTSEMLEKYIKAEIGINDSFLQKYWLRSIKQGNREITTNIFSTRY